MAGGWAVRKAATLLEPGQRFLFSDFIGGEGQVLTVTATADDGAGVTSISTEELDFDIEVPSRLWLDIQ